MDLLLSDDQEALRSELGRFLAVRCAPEVRRQGFARQLFADLGTMGVFGLVASEADGGLGLGLAEAVIVFEELGFVAAPGPLIPTLLAAGHVDGALDGTTVVGIAEPTRSRSAEVMVEHLDSLDQLLVLAGADVLLAESVPQGTAVSRPLDPLTPVFVVPRLPAGAPAFAAEGALRTAALLTGALHVGLGQAALDLAVTHAMDRQQFGRSIGSFQAIKHRLADAVVALEAARAGMHAAAVTADEGGDPTGRLAYGARVVASAAADRACRTSTQVHGGMGFTWDLDVHLFLKRSMVLDVGWAGVDHAIDRVADSVASARR